MRNKLNKIVLRLGGREPCEYICRHDWKLQEGSQVLWWSRQGLSGQWYGSPNSKGSLRRRCVPEVEQQSLIDAPIQRFLTYRHLKKKIILLIYSFFLLLSGIAIRISDVRSRLPQLGDASVVSGHAILQNPPSVICSRVLDPQPGERVLDMCAAPGNKTTHLSALMNGEGWIVALEKNKSKIDRLRANCRAFGCENVSIHCFDSTRAARGEGESDTVDEPPFQAESFHRVLLDGPCSALGQRPQLLNRITPKELRSYVPLQRKLFTAVKTIARFYCHKKIF